MASPRFDVLATLHRLHQTTALECILSKLSWADINSCFHVSLLWHHIVETILLNNLRLRAKLLEKKFIHDWFQANPGVLTCKPFVSCPLSPGTVVEQCLIAANTIMVILQHVQNSCLNSMAILDLITMKWTPHSLDLPLKNVRVGRVKDLSEHLLLFEKENFAYFVFYRKTMQILAIISKSMEADNALESAEDSKKKTLRVLQEELIVTQVRTLDKFVIVFHKNGNTQILNLNKQLTELHHLCYINANAYRPGISNICELNQVICFDSCVEHGSSIFFVDLAQIANNENNSNNVRIPVKEVVLPRGQSHLHLKLIRAAELAVISVQMSDTKFNVYSVKLSNHEIKCLIEQDHNKDLKPAIFVTDNHILLALKKQLRLFNLNDEAPLGCLVDQKFRCPFAILGIIHERLVALNFGSSYSSRRKVVENDNDNNNNTSNANSMSTATKTTLVSFLDLKGSREIFKTWREFHVGHEAKPNPYHMELYSQGLVHCAITWEPNLARDDLDIKIWQFAI